MGFIVLQESRLCLILDRDFNCPTNDNVTYVIDPRLQSILRLVPKIESLTTKATNFLLLVKFDRISEVSQNHEMTKYSQQLKRTAEAAIVTASAVTKLQSTPAGEKYQQHPAPFSSKGKIEEWVNHTTINRDKLGPEPDIFSVLMSPASGSLTSLSTNM